MKTLKWRIITEVYAKNENCDIKMHQKFREKIRIQRKVKFPDQTSGHKRLFTIPRIYRVSVMSNNKSRLHLGHKSPEKIKIVEVFFSRRLFN